jgi:hypothetical protein
VLISAVVNAPAAKWHRLVLLARRQLCGVARVPRSMGVLISAVVNAPVASEHRLVLLARRRSLWCSACAKEHGGVNISRSYMPLWQGGIVRCCWYEDKALWCSACAKEHGGVGYQHRKCQCGKRASFGVAGTKTRLWCSACAKEHGGVNIRSRRCPVARYHRSVLLARKLFCGVAHVPSSMVAWISQIVNVSAASRHRLVLLARRRGCGVAHAPRSMEA